MELRQAYQLINKVVLQSRGKKLSVAERAALKAAWLDIKYEQAIDISDDVSANYVSARVAPALWKMLTDFFQQPIKKKNIRQFLENYPQQVNGADPNLPQVEFEPNGNRTPLFGRDAELRTLHQLVPIYSCVNLYGESGIGKSHLVRTFVTQLQSGREFEQIIPLSLCHNPHPPYLVQSIFQDLNHDSISPNDAEGSMNEFLRLLKQHRYLLVFDSADAWGQGDKAVELFLRRLVEESIQSSVLIISRVPISIIAALESKQYPCYTLKLEGLQLDGARAILEHYQLQDSEQWLDLIQKYRSNPLALVKAAEMILNLFDGRVKQFIDLETTVMFEPFIEAYRSYPFSDHDIQILDIIREIGQATFVDILPVFDAGRSTLISHLNTLLSHSFIERQICETGYSYSVPPMLSKFLASSQLEIVQEH